MANQATTTYKVTGSRKAVNDLWNTLQKMEVNSKDKPHVGLAKPLGKSISSATNEIYCRTYILYILSTFLLMFVLASYSNLTSQSLRS